MPGAIRITDLPLLEAENEKDIIQLQRLVDGVWQDFYTDFATINGEARTYVLSFDLSAGAITETIYAPAVDELVVPLSMYLVYAPPSVQDGLGLNAQSFSGTSNPLDLSLFMIDNVGGIYNAIDMGQYTDMDEDLRFAYSPTGDVTGNATVYVQYAVLGKV
jgi:hypothetical protein